MEDKVKLNELQELVYEMRDAIEWYMDNCIPLQISKNDSEIFFNMGTKLIKKSKNIEL